MSIRRLFRQPRSAEAVDQGSEVGWILERLEPSDRQQQGLHRKPSPITGECAPKNYAGPVGEASESNEMEIAGEDAELPTPNAASRGRQNGASGTPRGQAEILRGDHTSGGKITQTRRAPPAGQQA
jgi:hypothetical protein